MNASLVMQDFETDSYWAILQGVSIAGEFKGTKLKELPYGKNAQAAFIPKKIEMKDGDKWVEKKVAKTMM